MSDPERLYLQVVFTTEQEDNMRDALKKHGYTWNDFEEIKIVDFFNFPYQVQYVFRHREQIGDSNYPDWAKGDSFVDEDDPHMTPFVATRIDREGALVISEDQGEEVLSHFERIRRVAKRGSSHD